MKLNTKRFKDIWPTITQYLHAKDIIAVEETCHRLLRYLEEEEKTWQICYDQCLHEPLNHLLHEQQEALPPRSYSENHPKIKMKRLMRARIILDPTHSLEIRLEQAQSLAQRQQKKREMLRKLVWINVLPSILLLTLALVSFFDQVDTSPLQKFYVVEDLLLVISIVVLHVSIQSAGIKSSSSSMYAGLLDDSHMLGLEGNHHYNQMRTQEEEQALRSLLCVALIQILVMIYSFATFSTTSMNIYSQSHPFAVVGILLCNGFYCYFII